MTENCGVWFNSIKMFVLTQDDGLYIIVMHLYTFLRVIELQSLDSSRRYVFFIVRMYDRRRFL